MKRELPKNLDSYNERDVYRPDLPHVTDFVYPKDKWRLINKAAAPDAKVTYLCFDSEEEFGMEFD